MIRLFPRLEEQIDSEQTPERVYTVLKAAVDAEAEFTGQVYPLGFRIVPRIRGRNSFLPVLTGTIRENGGGTVIAVTLQLRILIQVFLAVWFGIAGFCALCGILAVFTDGLKAAACIALPLGFMVLGQALVRFCFYGPAEKALKRLRELLG